jgi:hypothetical protein
MKNTFTVVLAVLLALTGVGLVVSSRVASGQAILVPKAEDVRYQLIGNEPIAGPDGFALVKDWSALMFKDRRTGECYLAFSRGSAISAVNVAQCPR